MALRAYRAYACRLCGCELTKLLLLPLELYDILTGEENIVHRRALVDAVTSDRAYSVEKAKRELGFKPRYDLRSGLEETLDWYRQHGYLE